MKINGIEIIGNGIHSAILAVVADFALSCTVFYVEQDENGVWNGPSLLPQRVEVITVENEMGVMLKILLADGREQMASLPTKTVRQLEKEGWLGNRKEDL